MATTLSTGVIKLDDGSAYKPKIVRAVSGANISSGVGNSDTFTPFETFGYGVARVHAHVVALAANTTVFLQVQTGPTSDNCYENLRGAGSTIAAAFGTTGVHTRTFAGLDRWAEIILHCAGDGACTDISVDIELA